jgi:hypothetical protein
MLGKMAFFRNATGSDPFVSLDRLISTEATKNLS